MQGLYAARPDVRAKDGVAAVVVKPCVVGGFEAASSIASWARSRGMQVFYSPSWALSAYLLVEGRGREAYLGELDAFH